MKKAINIILLAVFWGIIFAFLGVILKIVGLLGKSISFITTLYLILLFISITYKQFWSVKTFSNKKRLVKFLSVIISSFLVLLFLNNLVYKSYILYRYTTKENSRGWEGRAHQRDDTLGFKPIPNARAFHTFPLGDKMPMAYNNKGFRIPLSDTSKIIEPPKSNLLFLGCSFTYGDACVAEETFPYLIAEATNLSYINAGVCSYGLSHMLLLAERLIPEYKPEYVIVQYSPWLVSRGTNMFAPVYIGSVPSPYFTERDNSYIIEPPIYKSQNFNMDMKQSKSSYQNRFIKFLFEKGLEFNLYEDWQELKTKILLAAGQLPRPATNLLDVEKYAYNRIKTIAEDNEATIIVLNLGDIEYSKKSKDLFIDSSAYFAEADSFLYEYLKNSPSKDYSKEFKHWRFNGNDSILIDGHPNFKAHQIIANSVIFEINKIQN